MGSKGGGGASTAGLEGATQAATDLQRQIYEETRQDVQPWYQMGVGATSKLSDLLGITGGSVQGRDDIYNELMPQYTTGGTSAADSSFFRTPDGRILSADETFKDARVTGGAVQKPWDMEESAYGDYLGQFGYSPFSSRTSTATTDYDALNAAVDARVAEQGVTPEGFGSLLERFDESKLQDSAGYKFRQDEASKALERSMAAQGITLGGGGYGEINPQAYRAMEELNQGLASQEYQNEYNRYVGDQLNTFNMLMGASGSGQQATGQMAAGGQNYATNVGNLQTGLASAQYQNAQANQGGSMFGSLLGMGAGALLGNPSFGASLGGALFGR
jgi:hypothetical protein